MTLLLVVAALHAGFQAVVTVLVYPALSEVPTDRWAVAHAAHSRRITYLVGPLYLAILVACGLAVHEEPGSVALWAAVGCQGAALLVTATLAAPLHGVLGRVGPTAERLRTLVVVDRVRCLAAAAGLVTAILSRSG
ncbi:MAG: hypothetical protein NTV23_02285 [Propionibacteriales bacterium]|nr:hypothetical protein [Propionibacteriales bacterium]